MNTRIRRSLRCAVPSLLVLAFAGQVGAADTAVTIGGERGKTTYEVALDELHAVCIAPAALPGQVCSMTPDGKTRLSGVTSLPQLETVASTLIRGAAGRTTVAAVLYPAGGNHDPASRSILSRRLALHVAKGADPATVASRHHCRLIERLSSDMALVEPLAPGLLAGSAAATELKTDTEVRSAEVQVHRLVATRYTPLDPEFHPFTGANPLNQQYQPGADLIPLPERKQWHLFHAPRGMMLQPVWGSAHDAKDGYTGTGIVVAAVDTGVDTNHPDLGLYPSTGNLRADLAYNFTGGDTEDVRPQSVIENHGTAIAGLIVEREGLTGREPTPFNRPMGVGGVGVAFDATLVPIRYITSRDMGTLADPLSDNGGPADPNWVDDPSYPGRTEADFYSAVRYQLNPRGLGKQIHISCNSWGNTGVRSFSPLGETAMAAFVDAIGSGRSGRGMIFVWAAGNDHGLTIPYHPNGLPTDLLPEDNACYDAWLNRFTFPIGALNRGGRKTSYSEIGPCLLVCAPGGEYNLSPYEAYTPTDQTTGPGSHTPPAPAFLIHGLITTDRSREWLLGDVSADPGYNHGDWPMNGDLTKMGSNPVRPSPSEELPQWLPFPDGNDSILFWSVNANGDPIAYGYDRNPDFTTEANSGPDLDGDGYWDTGEDLDHDGHLDHDFWLDLDGDGHRDLGEDLNNNGILDPGEDVNGDGLLQRNEDLNGNGIFDPGEDLDGDGHFDYIGYVQFPDVIPIDTYFISEGLWTGGAGEPDFNHNRLQDSAVVVDVWMQNSGTPVAYTIRAGVTVDEDLNNDNNPVLDPAPTGSAYQLEGIDHYFDRHEDFNHDLQLTSHSNLNGDAYWGAEDANNDGKWTPGDYTQWMPTGYTHPSGPGWDVAGTSFAAANASGVIALMLQARPELTWRDVQHIFAHRSRLPGRAPEGLDYAAGPNRDFQLIAPAFFTHDNYDTMRGLRYDLWVPNAIRLSVGFEYNHWYGFGAINALKAIYGADSTFSILGAVPATTSHPIGIYPGWPVPLADQIANPGALHWPLLPVEETPLTATTSVDEFIPIADSSGLPRLNRDVQITNPGITDFMIETVELHLDISINNRSRLTLGLVSPSGTIAMIPQRISKNGGLIDNVSPVGVRNLDYTFTLRNFLGENPVGTWRIIVLDSYGGDPGVFNSATITVHGHRPYPVPNASGTTPTGLAATVSTEFQVSGTNFRRNANNEVTMTKALWIDRHIDLSADSADQSDESAALVGNEDLDGDGHLDVDEDLDSDGILDPGEDVDGDGHLDVDEDVNNNGILDLSASIAADSQVIELETESLSDGSMNVKVPAGLTLTSPGDAMILIANPALPVGQDLTAVSNQYHYDPGHAPLSAAESEDVYALSAWETATTSILVNERYKKVNGATVHTTYPAGVDPVTGVPFAAGYDCRIKSRGLNDALYIKYSRAPTITPIPDQLMPAGTSTPAITFTFTVDDPDINPATVMAGRTGLEENLTVEYRVFNQSVVRQSNMPVTAVVPRAVLQTITAPIVGSSGLSIVMVNVTDGVTTTSTSFRVGILTDETASGCGGGMGLALLGGPLAIWLFRRRRRA